METAKTHKKVMEKSVRRALILAKATACIKEIDRISKSGNFLKKEIQSIY